MASLAPGSLPVFPTLPATVRSLATLGRLIRSRGLTFRQIAAAGGPSPATLTRLLRGERHWRPEWVQVVATLLGLPVQDLEAQLAPVAPCSEKPPPSEPVRLPTPDEILTLREAAAFLKCSPAFLYEHQDLIRPARLGGRLRYFRSHLIEYLKGTVAA